MQLHVFAGLLGRDVTLDLCFACHGLWFDQRENQQLSPQGVIDLFRLLHAHRDDPYHPLAAQMACPACRRGLSQGFDLSKSGRYMTYRCQEGGHGRFSSFSAFLIEKGFVRLLSTAEVADLAQRVRSIACTNCGATVDLRKDHACPYCRSAFSLLDPQAVERALAHYDEQANRPPPWAEGTDGQPSAATSTPATQADGLIATERLRERRERERQQERWEDRVGWGWDTLDLWSLGLRLIYNVLR